MRRAQQLELSAPSQNSPVSSEVAKTLFRPHYAEPSNSQLRQTSSQPSSSPQASPSSRPGLKHEMVRAVTGYALHPRTPATPGATHDIRDAELRFDPTAVHVTGDGATVTYAAAGKPEPGSKLPRDPDAELLEQLGFEPGADVSLRAELPATFVLPPRRVNSAVS